MHTTNSWFVKVRVQIQIILLHQSLSLNPPFPSCEYSIEIFLRGKKIGSTTNERGMQIL